MNTFPKEFIDLANIHAAKRTAFNASTRESNKNYVSENPNYADFVGVLGELLACYELLKAGKEFFMNSLFDEKQVKAPDLIIGEFNVDVKASTNNTRLLVSVFKLKDSEKHNINSYWFFIIDLKNNTYTYKFHTKNEVAKWDIEKLYGIDYYIKKL